MGTISTPGLKDWSQTPLNRHPKKLIRYAEILAKGTYTYAEAARQAGYAESVADKQAYKWLGDSRADSMMPILYDYYEKLRKKNLRDFDVTTDNIRDELKLIAFSDITAFLELPRREYEKLRTKAIDMQLAYTRVSDYPILWQEYQRNLEAYERAIELAEMKAKGRKAPKIVRPSPPTPVTDYEQKLYDEFEAMTEDERRDLMFWRSYDAGSVRLKYAEDIPPTLTPVIAEIAHTRDGIRVKLHDKGAALDKLARFLKMYDSDAGSAGATVKEINIVVNGTKSTIKLEENEEPKE